MDDFKLKVEIRSSVYGKVPLKKVGCGCCFLTGNDTPFMKTSGYRENQFACVTLVSDEKYKSYEVGQLDYIPEDTLVYPVESRLEIFR